MRLRCAEDKVTFFFFFFDKSEILFNKEQATQTEKEPQL